MAKIPHWSRRSIPDLRLLLVAALFMQPGTIGAQNGPGPQNAEAPMVDYAIVITGGELLAGAFADGHTHFLTGTLQPLGLHCVLSLTVDDRPGDIKDALGVATRRARLVIVTGGLGPTENDVTRQSLAEFTGIALAEQPDVLREFERRLKTPRDQLRPNLRRQTQVPERGTYLKSPNGTAVGLVFEGPQAVIVALPGPPRELQPMVRDELIPYLSRRFGTHVPGASILLRFVGLGQSQISHVLDQERILPAGVIVSSQFEGSRVDYTFSLPGDTPQDRARLDDVKRKILAVPLLADAMYTDGPASLEDVVAGRLAARGATLALAEAGSGGALAAALSGSDSARRAVTGAYVAPSVDQLRRLLRISDQQWPAGASANERLQCLAQAAAEATGSQGAVAVGEVETDSSGNRYVPCFFLLAGGRAESHRLEIRGSGEPARGNLTTQLLDQLRRRWE